MLFKLKFLIALAISLTLISCNADWIKDPDTFVRESFAVLNTLRRECQDISEDLENVSLDMNENVSKWKNCGDKLLEIASAASTYDLSKIENSRTKDAVKLFRNVEKRYKLGDDMQVLYTNLMPFINSYTDEDIEYYDDSDVTYSLDEIYKGDFVTRMEDINEINYYWSHVAEKVGGLTWENFFPFVDLIQKKAKVYNLTAAEFWYPNYSEETMTELDNFIKELKPFYQELHAYIRFKLLNRYGTGVVKKHGPIPESLYQQVEDRVWSSENHYEEDFPWSNVPNFENIFENHKIDTKKLLEYAVKYYTSLGFENVDERYWKDHMRQVAGDSYQSTLDRYYLTLNDRDAVNFENFLINHEHFGSIYDGVFQKDIHWLYWENHYYSRIIGRAVRLAAATKKYQEELGLLIEDDVSEHWMATHNVNMAFMEVFDLMRRYVNIRVVIDLLANKVDKDAINRHYWTLFEEYAGVEPPIDRTDESLDLPYWLVRDVFDNINLIRDFEVKVHGFDFYAAACHLSKHTGPLNECTFYSAKNVGNAFKEILATGLRKPFSQAVEPLIPNYKHLNTEAFLSYFEPTFNWMKLYNKKHNLTTGWDHTKKKFNEETLTNEEEATTFVEESNKKIFNLYDQIVSDLFNKKNEAQEFESDFYGNVFWKISKAAEAASELTEISMKAKQYDTIKIKSKPLKKALWKLAEVADVFVLGEDLETLVYNKQRLYNLSIDDDIVKYKDTSDAPITVPFNPYILNVFKTSNDAKELKYYWEEWRERNYAFAKVLSLDIFKSFKKAADILEISTTEFWYKHYSNDYIKKMEKVIDSIRPFYQKLHYYVSELLLKKYDEDNFSSQNRAIPDHFVQQVLAQIWTNESIVEDDFPWHQLPPQEQGIANKNYDAIELFKIAEEFYQSLGFEPLEDSFWEERVKVEEGSDIDGNCHATVIDYTPKVYMKYCERVSFRKLLQAHGYLGRIHYAVEKKDLPAYYFDSYDFEYPVGEAIILSAASPKHVEKIGLISGFEVTDKVLLNRLIRMAIHTMFNLHKYFVHTKLIDAYLQGEIEEDEINKYYWKYMITYAGIEPPNDRMDDHFDFPFEFYTDLEQNHQVRKFTAEVLGYRIYERLCNLSEHEGDLNNCDFFGSIEAGNALKSMMKLGSSLPRKTVLKRLLQDANDLKANSLLNYYEPLEKWLKKTITDEVPSAFDSFRKSLKSEYFV